MPRVVFTSNLQRHVDCPESIVSGNPSPLPEGEGTSGQLFIERPDYESAVASRLACEPRTLEDVTHQLVQQLSGMFIWGHPRSQSNVTGVPTIASIVGGLLPSIYNPNLCSEESAQGIAEAEVKAISMTADLVGYDSNLSGGLFTFGGTGTLLYGIRLGLEKACADAMKTGVNGQAVVFCSEQAHYAVQTASWLARSRNQQRHQNCDE